MKRNSIARIVIYSLVVLMLTGILLVGIAANGFTYEIGSSHGTVTNGEASLDASQIQNIEIDWASGSITIRSGDEPQITVSETSEDSKYQMTYAVRGNTLSLDYSSSTICIGFGNFTIPAKDLVITVPQDWVCKDLEIDGASLDITIEDLNLQTLDLDGASCSLRYSGSVENVEIDGASADIDLNCANPVSDININGASCDLELTLPEGCGFWVQMDGLSCSFRSDLDYSTDNGSYFRGDWHCRISVDGLSCDVYIRESK